MPSIEISRIRRDIACQPREALASETVEEYAAAMKAGAVFPPVTLFNDGNIYWLADGYHRVAGAETAGLDKISAEIKEGDRREAILHSLSANAAHGLRRTYNDKRRAVERMLRDDEWSKWSNRRLAEHCGVSDPFVLAMRKEIVPAGANNEHLTRKGKDGKSYPAARVSRGVVTDRDVSQAEPEYEESVRRVDEEHDADTGEIVEPAIVPPRTAGSDVGLEPGVPFHPRTDTPGLDTTGEREVQDTAATIPGASHYDRLIAIWTDAPEDDRKRFRAFILCGGEAVAA